jgi:DNA-binding NarL/FixJ family response regulator
MFGMSGYETAVWVKQHHSSVKIVVLSMFSAPVQIARMLTAGIKGFLDKNIEPEELYRALRYVAMNETLYMEGNHGKLAELVSSLGEPALLDKRRVTEREIEFIQLACCDYTHREIARRMHVSGRTESNIMASVYQKLQVKSRAAMVMSAARMGIVPLYQ